MPNLNALVAAAAALMVGGPGAGAAVLGPHAAACAAGAGKPALLVRIDGLKARDGFVRVQAYGGDPARWFEKGSYIERVDVTPPAGGAFDVCIPVPAAGTYAVSVKHDREAGGGLSIKDGGGFSGNPDVSAMDAMFRRKPSPAQVAVAVHGLTRVPVTIRYLQLGL